MYLIVIREFYFEDFVFFAKSQKFISFHFLQNMEWFFEGFENTCFTIHESIFQMVNCRIEQQSITFPIHRLDRKLFANNSNPFQPGFFNNNKRVLANNDSLAIPPNNTLDFGVFNLTLRQSLPRLNIKFSDNIVMTCNLDKLVLLTGTKYPWYTILLTFVLNLLSICA